MLRLLCILVLTYISLTNAAYDAVMWSSNPLNDKSISSIVSSASTKSPVIVYAVNGFTLATFSVKSNAYNSEPSKSDLISDIRKTSNRASLSMDQPVQIPQGAIVQKANEVADKTLAVFYLSSWEDVEKLEPQVARDLKTPFTAIISSSEAFSTNPVETRKKRVSVSSDVTFDEDEEPANQPKRPKGKAKTGKLPANLTMPVVLPPVNITGSDFKPTPTDYCLLYLEAVNIVVMKVYMGGQPKFRNLVVDSANGTNTFLWNSSYVTCKVNNQTIGFAKFQIRISVNKDMIAYYDKAPVFVIHPQIIAFELTFNGTYTHYWNLVFVSMLSDLKISQAPNSDFLDSDITLPGSANTSATQYMGVESFYQYAYACSGTQAAFMQASKDYTVGIALNNFEVDLKAYHDPKYTFLAFNRDVNDCVGTFSVGSWMGIIVSVVLASVLMFGYLMLQSIQTMDRFDDPKQKQIIINFKE